MQVITLRTETISGHRVLVLPDDFPGGSIYIAVAGEVNAPPNRSEVARVDANSAAAEDERDPDFELGSVAVRLTRELLDRRLPVREFRRLHHGNGSPGRHLTYCQRLASSGSRFRSATNTDTSRRMFEALRSLRDGASAEEAVARALRKYPK